MFLGFLSSLFLLFQYAKIEPQSAVGTLLFELRYASRGNTDELLINESARLGESNGWYVPAGHDQLLMDQLRLTKQSVAERDAILKFYLRHRGIGESRIALSLSDQEQYKLIDGFVDLLREVSDEEVGKVIGSIDELRTRQTISKEGFYGKDLAEARRLVIAWWGDGQAWPDNRKIDPLDGSGMGVGYGP